MTTAPPPTRSYGEPFEPMAFEESVLARAFEPSAYGGFYEESARPKPYRMAGAVAVVSVLGPLDTRAGWWCDSYDQITARHAAAFADPAVAAVVSDYDSPGGACAGNLDAADALRAMADAAGKPLVAHAGAMACSAAYALAVAADHIVVTRDGLVGSIGVIATVYDRTKMNEALGLDVRVVRSGNLKADPHPDVALTDASVARVRARVNDLAAAFAAHVAARRPQTGDPLSLQGATFAGAAAVTKGLADTVGTLSDAITHAAQLAADSTAKRKTTMDGTKALEVIGALRASLDVKTDEEVAATVATLRQRASQVEALSTELATARQQLADRDAAQAASARAAIFDKHTARGALTPAMRADAEYMGDLAPLGAESLDRVLSKLPSAPAAVTPRSVGAVDPTGVDPASIELTADDKAFAKAAGLSEASFLATKRADAARASR